MALKYGEEEKCSLHPSAFCLFSCSRSDLAYWCHTENGYGILLMIFVLEKCSFY